MNFYTFRNPDGFEVETGFYDGASERVLDMILFRNVGAPVESAVALDEDDLPTPRIAA